MAKATETGGSNKRKPITPGAPGTKMTKQEVPFGGIGKAVVKGAVSVAKKVVAKDATKVAAKVEKKALKAANKPTSKNNASVNRNTSTYVADSLKNAKPANPNVTRGGSMKSKLNWPESTKTADAAKSKNAKKLDQLDRRSNAVAPKKKYSDMTPAEKRKWDSLNAEITNRLGKK